MELNFSSATEVQDTFRRVFAAITVPYFAVDTEKVVEALRAGGPHIHSSIDIPLIGQDERRGALVGAWRGLINALDPPDWVVAAILGAPSLRDARVKSSAMPTIPDDRQPTFVLGVEGDNFRWIEETMWPLAYSTLLLQLNSIVVAQASRMQAIVASHREGLEQAGWDGGNVAVLDETTRNQPTDLHFAFASLGAWLGGATNVHYFASYAIAPQLRSKEYALKCAREVGFTASDARDLHDGGIVAVPPTVALPLVQAQGSVDVFGSIPLNEHSLSNPPAVLDAGAVNQKAYAGFLIDKQYRGGFLARPLRKIGLYGGRNVLRDHFDDFYERRKADDLLRCRQFAVPVYEIDSIDEAREIVTGIPIRDELNGILFRGQTSFYKIERPLKVKQLLFGNSCAIEPSLSTSASRHKYNYDPAHFALRFFLENFTIPGIMKDENWKGTWREALLDPTLSIDFAMMALAQHYGLPSHGLDVTTDLDVAAWFATQRYTVQDGIARYDPLKVNDWSAKRRQWPTLFVFQNVSRSLNSSLQDCRELEGFGIRALRPERQHARFFLGGHSEHQNRLAETMVCAFRLKPGHYTTVCDFDHLFPSPEDDPAYSALLSFADSHFSGDLKRYVNRFHA